MNPSTKRLDLPGHALMRQLLADRNQNAERIPEIDATIREKFERTVSILVLDMVGFSRLTRKHGIIFYLSMIAQMESAARPAVEGNGGRVIKQEADNLFAVFDSPVDAMEGALDIFRGFEAINGVMPDDRDIFGSVGIGHGPTLLIDDVDLFGCEVNSASKLGEDIAAASEILLTPAAHAGLPPDKYRFDPDHLVMSGVDFQFHRFRAKLNADGQDIPARTIGGRPA
jgi:class 3 adenylate cyclase